MIIKILLIKKRQKIQIAYFFISSLRIFIIQKYQQMRKIEMTQKCQEIEKQLNNVSIYQEIQEKQQKQLSSIKEKLFCYLNELLKKFKFFSTNEVYLEDTISFNKKKEYHPIFLNFISFDWDIQNDKQQFSTLLYFKVFKQIQKIPGPRARNLSHIIQLYYLQMVKSKNLHFLQFYRFIVNNLFEQLGRLLNSQTLTHSQRQKGKSNPKNSFIKYLYDDIMEIDHTYSLYNSLLCRRNSTGKIDNSSEFLELALGRNEKIIEKVIKFSTQIREYSIKQKYRSLTVPKEQKAVFKIRKSQSSKKENININQMKKVNFNIKTNQQRDEISIFHKDQLKKNRLYLKPIHNFKNKIKLRLF